jgi:mycothiol synthase
VQVEVFREVEPDRIEQLKELFDAVREADHHDALGEHKWLDLVHGGRSGFAGVVASDGDDEGPIGYAQLSRHPNPGQSQWGLEVVVHPDHRGAGVEDALVGTSLDVVRDTGGGHLHWWVFQPAAVHDEVAERRGLVRGRDLLHMRIALPIADEPALPEGMRIRAFEPGRDEQTWLDLNNRAFMHHPEQGAWDLETLERRMREPWFDARDLLIAEDDEGVAGSNWTKIDPDHAVGEIYVIAVDPSHHGTGLGKGLSIAGLRHMHDRGMLEGSLYVDSANEKALKMYTGIGFEVHHRDRAYVADVPPR